MKTIGTFQIIPSNGGFDVFDRCTFNSWGSRLGMATEAEAKTFAEWAHAFKTGRTMSSLADWCKRFES